MYFFSCYIGVKLKLINTKSNFLTFFYDDLAFEKRAEIKTPFRSPGFLYLLLPL